MTHSGGDTALFESISYDMVEKGYVISPSTLSANLTSLLVQHIIELSTEISWITQDSEAFFLDKLNRVITSFGTIVVFLSEKFPHEVSLQSENDTL